MGKKGRRGSTNTKTVIPRALRKQTTKLYLKPQFTTAAVAERWDPRKSASMNLAALGLAHDPNRAVTHGNPQMGNQSDATSIKAISAKAKDPCELFEIPQSDTLRGDDINERRRALPQLEVDQKYASKLLAVHGNDYKAMARDIKRNDRQSTPAQLKRLCSRFILLGEHERLAPLPAKVAVPSK